MTGKDGLDRQDWTDLLRQALAGAFPLMALEALLDRVEAPH
ncbi:hypothetical protein [Fuscovulum blasticum]|nr:hypothetical protein [Fuscovulum blasticum]